MNVLEIYVWVLPLIVLGIVYVTYRLASAPAENIRTGAGGTLDPVRERKRAHRRSYVIKRD